MMKRARPFALTVPVAIFAALTIGGCGRDIIGPSTAPVLAVFSGDAQRADWGHPLPSPLVVQVTSPGTTSPAANLKVNWGVISGGGVLSARSSRTDNDGKASVSWTLGTTGAQLVKAWLDAPGAGTTTFSASPLVPLVKKTSGDGQSAPYGRQVPTPLVATVTGPTGEPLANVKVNWGVVAGGGTVSASSSTTDQAGNASVQWTLGTATNQVVKAWIDAEGTEGVDFLATGEMSKTTAMHFDGTNWTRALETPAAPNGCCGVSLTKIWGASPSSVFAGGSNCGGFFTTEFDGTSWKDFTSCGGGGLDAVTGIGGTSATDVWAVVSDAYPPNVGQIIEHFDGQTWTNSYSNHCNLIQNASCKTVIAVWSRAANDVFAVGRGLLLHYDGASWTPQSAVPSATLRAIWGDATTGELFAVGDGGTIYHYDGNAWAAQASGTARNLTSVWGTSATDVFAVGDGGTILHYDGTSWVAQNGGTTINLHAVWASQPNVVFAGGDAGTIMRYDGTKWSTQTLSQLYSVNGIWGTSGNNVFAVGTHN